MKDWADLPVSAQMKRMRSALAGVLPRWGLGRAELKFIFHGENTTFRALTPRGSFLVRVHREGYNTPEQSVSELAWVEALHNDTGLAPKPHLTRDGELVAKLDAPGVAATHVCVFHWIEGSVLGARQSISTVRESGELMARLHQHAAGWNRPTGFKRHDWQKMALFGHDEMIARDWLLLPAEHRSVYEPVRAKAIRVVESLSGAKDTGLLHADLHHRNVLRTPSGLVAIDFDDCGFAPWVYDIAVALAYSKDPLGERFDAMMEGYHRVREFPQHQLKYLSLLVVARLASVSVWVSARAQQNASFSSRATAIRDRLLKQARLVLDTKN